MTDFDWLISCAQKHSMSPWLMPDVDATTPLALPCGFAYGLVPQAVPRW
jgi:hypothetical protein